MELSIVILNWNAAADTIACVQAIAGWRALQSTVWVVDNASTDNSVAAITRACPHVQLILNNENLGYAAGNNRGIVAALTHSNAPIMLQNNDAAIAEADVMCLLETLQAHPRVGFVAPLLFDARCPDQLLAAGGRNIAFYINSHIINVPVGGGLLPVAYVPGTVMVGRAEVFRQTGLLDADYFFTGETPDLCRRAKQQGYTTMVNTQSKAWHALADESTYRQTLYPYYLVRNRFLFVRKFYPRLKYGLYVFWGVYGAALILKLRINGNPAMARAVQLGVWDGLRGWFGGQNRRVLAFTTDKG
jgi:GT2 family glycosyltransferase